MRPADDVRRVWLEASILDAMGEADAAQALRWRDFEAGLSADVLRDYLGRVDEFSERDERERASVKNDLLTRDAAWSRFRSLARKGGATSPHRELMIGSQCRVPPDLIPNLAATVR